ncbi:CDP-diacylglycerol--glycerol-3-phosphate 3-phosphatidyltransferase [filamentous cyanobacterium Phorm 46]|nr:CDP-diacylglycerol--glycerol-3-phosphate 3-phosphatidyltransferase [filamentous cyanobacterium Phorm 46]PSB52112.1 CDP-diacylglycerol--glycerol-3-phosphate 3-phosphatidyltransferase [filamentous cyanobacterium Phorm 6]
MMKFIPGILVALRVTIAPFLLWDAIDGTIGVWFIIGYLVGFFSDIFDGVIARRIGVSNAQLRQADSWADVCFYICVFVSAWLVHRDVVIAFRVPLLVVLFVQLVWWMVNLVKYGKPASYHTYSAKFWGITLFIATVALFGFNYGGIPLWLAIISGIIHTVEEIAMTLLLPEWKHDILSVFHALRLRRELSCASPNND